MKQVCYYTVAVVRCKQNPGLAKFGIALEWGSRGRWFESSNSDQNTVVPTDYGVFLLKTAYKDNFYIRSEKTEIFLKKYLIFPFLCVKIPRSEKARCVLCSAGNHIAGLITVRTPNIKEDEDMDLVKALSSQYMKEELPEMRVGDTVRVHVRIKEGSRERIQVFEGTIIARKHGGIGETITVRRISYGVGCEKVFPVHSPRIAAVETVRKGKVRRAKLYYLRDRFGKAAKIKEKV